MKNPILQKWAAESIFMLHIFLVKIHYADLEAIVILAIFGCILLILPASHDLTWWRKRLARRAEDREAPGSSPTRD